MSLVLGSGHSDGPNKSNSQGDAKCKIVRKNANFHPSVWGNHFITSSPDDLKPNPQMQQRASELKEEVKKMLGNVKNCSLKEINMIDAIQRLGVACHFEKEMADALLRIYNEDTEGKYESDDDLHAVALRFRLLRQEGYCVSTNVFTKFKDEKGKFKETLAGNIRGLVSLYEASHFVIHGEDILDEANSFARKHLKLALPNLNSPLSSLVQLALELPLRKSIERLLSRYYIAIYQEEDERNDNLLEFAKLDFNLLQSLHKVEIREISMWWKHWDFGAKLPFIRDRVVECYFWILAVYPDQQYSRARRITTKCISLTSILDDIYDVYGTLEELELYTNVIERWDRSMVDQLPDFMKLHFVALLDAVDEFEEELALEEKSYRISFLKDAFKEISKYFLIEAQWFNTGYVPTYEEYMNVALITCGYKLLTLISFVGMGDIATTEAFEWARSMPKLIKAVSIVNRLRDDITSNKMEQERGHVVSSIEVYMKQYGGTYEETCTKFRELVADAWKDINEECLKPMAFPMALLIRPVNFARVMEVLYQHRDGYTESTHETKERISMVLVNRIPV
ncbi:terpene synthase 1 [Cinnamomum micranthum f. kanehirae]|uniref:Terpene synthase 1 n=1 Tax=Cinnamomum micranthum f. kanehirae TaxID=337451 RepID=A0A3S3PDD0_9MAGN|nr:terpene synthase 1 [Cinnamomum micranthum f. kanehirae]